jgi:voltage-gated potassium channel Kch
VKIDSELRQRLNPWDWLVLVVAVVSLLLVILETFLHVPPAVLSVLRTADMLSCGIFLTDVFKNGGDALWWALTTVTTVGYGDTVPVTGEGRLIASVLMLVGVALFGSMSAIVTSKLILPKETRDHEELRKEMRDLHAEIRELRRHLPDKPSDPHA